MISFIIQSDDITKVAKVAKIIGRMVTQNTFDDIAQGNYSIIYKTIM